jgi:chemotaxis protein CheD
MSNTQQIAVSQGKCFTTSDPGIVFYTPLGSCISACMYDPVAGVGGMNHFLLPAHSGNDNGSSPGLFGIDAMPILLDGMLDAGALPARIVCKLFGGSRTVFGGRDIGLENKEFAEEFLFENGIRYLGGLTGKDESIAIHFHAARGSIQGRRYPKLAARFKAPAHQPDRVAGAAR